MYDGGIDFILYNEQTGDTKLIQLKGRWLIDRKYIGRSLWLAFHDDGCWYVAPHDEMVKHAEAYGYTKSASWTGGGAYSVKGLTKQMRLDLQTYRFQPLEAVSEEAADAEAGLELR